MASHIVLRFCLVCMVILAGCSNREAREKRMLVKAQSARLPEALAVVREGRGLPQAASYDPASPGPHRLVLVTPAGDPHEWRELLPTEWRATTFGELALVVVVDPKEVRLGSQDYYGGPPITRYRHDLLVEVRAARTSEVLTVFTLEGEDPKSFPSRTSVHHIRIDGEKVDFGRFEEALLRFVQPLETPAKQTMQFVWVEPGTFVMGSPESLEELFVRLEKKRSGWNVWEHELQHPVTLTRGFWMQTTEVTQWQWQAVMGNNPSRFKGDNRPVENVSWDDAQLFIRKLNGRDPGKSYRLPTEAEWEYACRVKGHPVSRS